MKNWEEKTIGALGKVITGKTPPKEDAQYFAGGEELFVSPKDMDWDQFYVTETETNVTTRALEKFKNQVIPRNAIMFTSLSFGFGKMGIASRNCLTNQQINTVVTNDNHDCRFVFYLLKAYKPIIFSYNSGIDTPIVPKSVFERIGVSVPDLKTQRKIAGILSAYDDLIENNKRRIALLEGMAEEIYREWFVRFRFPGWREAEFEKGIPKGWMQTPLGEIANILMGQSPASEFYNTTGNGLPFHQGVGTYGDRFPNNENFCSVSGRTANEGDILFSVRAPVGRLNIASEKMIIGRGLSSIRHKDDCQSYLFYLLKSVFSNEDIIGNGSIFNSVGKDELIGFKIFKPNQVLIKKFEEKVSVMDKQTAILLKSTQKLVETKNALLPRLISGKLAVEDLAVQLPPSMREVA